MTFMLRKIARSLRTIRSELELTTSARAERRRDLRMGLGEDPGRELSVKLAVGWLCRAQDASLLRDGGVARHFSLLHGWSASYPEVTGYIIPTMLSCAAQYGDDSLRQRARRMLDWLISIQLPEGGFQGGVVGTMPLAPTAFNTGQILLGLARGVRAWGNTYRPAMGRAAAWLVAAQDADGCWRRYPSPFAMPGEKTYDTHVAWGLLEAARLEPEAPYADAALANIRWALKHQRANGWFERCCLANPDSPLTHTLGYALRGVLEAYRFTGDDDLLHRCQLTADGLLAALRGDGFIPGCLDSQWRGTVDWCCLTGSVQIAFCWLTLYQITGDARYREAAFSVNRYVRRTVRAGGDQDTRGGIKGSFPVSGAYGRFEYLAWAAKFFIDSNLLERAIREEEQRWQIAL